MLSIGEFSQATRLTVKTLRFYHELGILVPVEVDRLTGYRYYDDSSYERAFCISTLKELGFTLQEIGSILEECESEEDLLRFIRKKLEEVRYRIKSLKALEGRLSFFDRSIDAPPPVPAGAVEEITLEIPYLAAVSVRGTYATIATGFRTLYRKAGRLASGAPYGFFYDMEYKEDDAVMEAVFALSREAMIGGVECRNLPEHRAVRILYKGPYSGVGSAYMKLFEYCGGKGYTPVPPVVERYLKGPGLIFKGNPEHYLTECNLLVQEELRSS